jgi:hypothetical protein
MVRVNPYHSASSILNRILQTPKGVGLDFKGTSKATLNIFKPESYTVPHINTNEYIH